MRSDDRIGDPKKNYREQYVALRATRPDLRNRMYGHAVEAGGRLWLQYWFFYFYNDYNLALGIGLHEGDWEMVQLRMHDGVPDLAVYAQHRQAEKRPWAQVGKVPGDPNRPMVYVARGSHASYFEPGFHQTEAWYDLADGKRNSPRTTLEIVTDDEPPWIAWPGVWGDTRARVGGIDQPSPRGPSAHAQWTNPDEHAGHRLGAPAQGRHRGARGDHQPRGRGRMRVDFDFTRQAGPPAASLQVTVNSRDEAGVPPRTYTFQVAQTRRGTLTTDVALDPAKHYDVYASTTSGDPPVPSESTLTELDPAGKVAKLPFAERSWRVRAAGGAGAGTAGALSDLRRRWRRFAAQTASSRGARERWSARRGSARALVAELRRLLPETGSTHASRTDDDQPPRHRHSLPSVMLFVPAANAASERRRSALAVLQVPRRQDPRPLGGDGDGELEVGGQRAVLGVDRPAVVAHAHAVAPGVDHGLDGEDHALLQQRPAAGIAVVGDLGVLVHRAPDAVADERAHDAEAVALDARLHGVRDVAQAVAGAALLDGVEERGLRGLQQLARPPA